MLHINLLPVAIEETVDVISIFASYFSSYDIVNTNKQTRNKENDIGISLLYPYFMVSLASQAEKIGLQMTLKKQL